jgi:uncharacterized 2Fe-2S/4Fe-4S cluster protein (DUF4445 family)
MKVFFKPTNRSSKAGSKENLLEVATRADVHINASCGGQGTCGKCKVLVEDGKVKTKSTGNLTNKEIANGYVLACQSEVVTDLVVDVPLESELISKGRTKINTLVSSNDYIEKQLRDLNVNPLVVKKYVELDPPSLADSVSDQVRLQRALRPHLQSRKLSFSNTSLRQLAKVVRQGDWKVTASLFLEDGVYRLIKTEVGDTSNEHYAFALDLGTTTCVLKLVDLVSKKVIAEASAYNGQISCGEDVISRMVYAKKGNGLEILQHRATETIDKLIRRVLRRAKIAAEKVSLLVVAGNTVMTHLLFGISPEHIRETPYIPVFRFPPVVIGKEIGLNQAADVRVVAFPCVASYLGGDITSGIVASDLLSGRELSLYIDIGTNGEIVLGNSEWLLGCSCSAGPAFEGAGVKDGVRSIDGAIERVIIEKDSYETVFETINSKMPVGICGSGLIDLLAEMFMAGVVDKRGKMNRDLGIDRIRKGDYGWEFVVAWGNVTAKGRDIVITEVDVDNLMRAKAAVYAGITTLVDSVGLKLSNIDQILIAGSFGNYIRIQEAVTIGLLPDLPAEKFKFVGNGSLLGSTKAAIDSGFLRRAEEISKNISYQELSADNKFMDRYVSALFLPHTNETLFPSVKSRQELQRVS